MLNYKIHFIKHGFCDENLRGIYTGAKTDSNLCEDSILQLESLSKKYEYEAVQKVYLSPLKRCLQTKDILYKDNYSEIVNDLIDLDIGDFDGVPIGSLENDENYINWLGNTKENTPPNGEDFTIFENRVKNVLNYIIMDMMKRKITKASVITHSMVLMNLLTRFGLPQLEPFRWMIGNGKGVTVLVNSMMWGRDEKFEIAGIVPYGLEDFR